MRRFWPPPLRAASQPSISALASSRRALRVVRLSDVLRLRSQTTQALNAPARWGSPAGITAPAARARRTAGWRQKMLLVACGSLEPLSDEHLPVRSHLLIRDLRAGSVAKASHGAAGIGARPAAARPREQDPPCVRELRGVRSPLPCPRPAGRRRCSEAVGCAVDRTLQQGRLLRLRAHGGCVGRC